MILLLYHRIIVQHKAATDRAESSGVGVDEVADFVEAIGVVEAVVADVRSSAHSGEEGQEGQVEEGFVLHC